MDRATLVQCLAGPRPMGAIDLIVNADDFGLSERVNQGIVDAHRRGLVTSTSLIAAGEAFDNAIALAKATPTLDIGVHLTLVGERPVLWPDIIPTLVTEEGLLHPDALAFVRHYLLRRVSLDQVRRELDAQISRVVSRDIRISHLDGHQHLHMLPQVRIVVGELARKYGIASIRYPKELFRFYMLREFAGFLRIPQMLLLNFFCSIARTSDSLRPDHFCGFYHGGRLSKENLLAVLENLPTTGTCELMCHPGLNDPDSRHGHWGYQWQAEFDALTDTEVHEYVKSRGIRLIAYSALQSDAILR
jgi:chitin disaccharide deacetylase